MMFAPHEPTLFQCGNQAVDTGFRPQAECVFHLVKRRRKTGLLQVPVDIKQEFMLFTRQHEGYLPPERNKTRKLILRSMLVPTLRSTPPLQEYSVSKYQDG